jgi:hypothetical protein
MEWYLPLPPFATNPPIALNQMTLTATKKASLPTLNGWVLSAVGYQEGTGFPVRH